MFDPPTRFAAVRRSTLRVGTLVALLAAAYVLGRGVSVSRSARTAPPVTAQHGFDIVLTEPAPGRIPAEFEHQDALMLSVRALAQDHPRTLVDIVTALQRRLTIVALISDASHEGHMRSLLVSHGLPADGIHFFQWPVQLAWVRDFGPFTILGDEPRLLDYDYWIANCEPENQLPLAMAARYGLQMTPTPLTFEGGNLLVNGRGLAFSTETVVEQNQTRGYGVDNIAEIMRQRFGISQWVCVPPLAGEPTSHVDMFMTMTSPTTAVIGAYEASEDPQNAKRLDVTARLLASLKTDSGPLEVVRIPMPPNYDGRWRTYTNVVYVNGMLLVPQFPDVCPQLDEQALEVYRKLLPDWQVVGIDASSLIEHDGGLHCATCNLPYFPAAAAVPAE